MADENGNDRNRPNIAPEPGMRPTGEKEVPPDFGAGTGGYCVCSDCGERVLHQKGIPCFQERCPKCAKPMSPELEVV
jgi:hypothetical protein